MMERSRGREYIKDKEKQGFRLNKRGRIGFGLDGKRELDLWVGRKQQKEISKE